MSGYVHGQRDRFEHPLFRNEKFCRGYAWDWLVAHAAFRDHNVSVKGQIVTIRRGQLCHSVRHLATTWRWSRSSVDRFLLRLRTEHMIGTATGTGQLVITICNYDKYQAALGRTGTARGTAIGTAPGQDRRREEVEKRSSGPSVPEDHSDACASGHDVAEPLTLEKLPKETSPPDGAGFARSVFELGVRLLCRDGMAETTARSLIGRWRKDNGDGAVAAALAHAERAGVTDLRACVTRLLRPDKPPAVDLDAAFAAAFAKLREEGTIQ